MLPKMSGRTRNFNDTKCMSFLKDDRLGTKNKSGAKKE